MKWKTAKEILAESFREIAEMKPIDKITVKDITKNCGYSTATFYRQFKDKYDLIAWAYSRDLEKILDRIAFDETSWKKTLIDAADYYHAHREYLANLLLNTKGYDSFIRNMTEINTNSLTKKILQSAKAEKPKEETAMLIHLYTSGSVFLTCEWILGKFDADPKKLATIYEVSLPEPLKQYLHEK